MFLDRLIDSAKLISLLFLLFFGTIVVDFSDLSDPSEGEDEGGEEVEDDSSQE